LGGVVNCAYGAVSVGSVACHRLLALFCVPVRITVLLCVIVTVVSVNMAMHCASQSCLMGIREVVPRAGKICTVHAFTGKFGKSNSCGVCGFHQFLVW